MPSIHFNYKQITDQSNVFAIYLVMKINSSRLSYLTKVYQVFDQTKLLRINAILIKTLC